MSNLQSVSFGPVLENLKKYPKMFDTALNEKGTEKYVNFEEAKQLMQKLLEGINWIKLIETLNLKRAVVSEADVDEKVGSTSKMIVKINKKEGKNKYAVYFIKLRLRWKSDPN